jgi:hypothetical protein
MNLRAYSRFQGFLAVNAALPPDQIPIGIAIVTLFQYTGGSIFLSIDQAIFANSLRSSLETSKFADQATIERILAVGATSLRSVVSPSQLSEVLVAYNKALTAPFYLACSAAAAAFAAALFIEWRSVKREALAIGEGT